MQPAIEIICLVLFFLLIALPSLYGFHMYLLMFLAARRRRHVRAAQRVIIERFQRDTPDEQWPVVTTQLPLYNELAVAQRIIEAVDRMRRLDL